MKRNAHNRLHGIRILFEDADVIVIEKAAGILTQATRRGDDYSVEGALTDYVRKGQWKSSKRIYLVHRLDRETSGVMMVAKSEAVMDWYRDHWNEVTRKTYLARVEGRLEQAEGVFESYLREDENYFVRSVKNPQFGKFARTEWKVLDAEKSLVEVQLKSGRKNQIRVHFSEAGHPVVGDSKYGQAPRNATLCLHAWKLEFKRPGKKAWQSFEAPPPAWTGLAPRKADDEAGRVADGVRAERAESRGRRPAKSQRPL